MIYRLIILVCFFSLKTNATQWTYLKSEPFKLRYILAAHYLKSCSEIVEIGGYKTPISDFLENKKIIVIDPLVSPRLDGLVSHYIGTLDSWLAESNHYFPSTNNYGVLILGFHLEDMSPDAWNYLYQLVENSSITIIEFPIDWFPSQQQFEQLLLSTNKKIIMKVNLDLIGNDFGDLTNSWPPKTTRCMYFLSK